MPTPTRRLISVFSCSSFALLLLFTGVSCSLISTAPEPVVLGKELSGAAVFPFLPSPEKNTGAAVVLVPDVAVVGSEIDPASLKMARWLADRGIAAFVLRSADPATGAADASTALTRLPERAAEFKIAPARLGLAGVGGGAATAASVGYAKGVPRPAFLGLFWGKVENVEVPADGPATFLVGSSLTTDNLSSLFDLWTKLRNARVAVDAHFFAKRDASLEAGFKDKSAVSWPEMFYTWARFQGYLTEQPRLALKGMAYVDGQPLAQGHVIFTPVDFVGAGPVVGRVLNFTAGVPIGEFSIPANQGPVPGRYKVELRQNANRWLGNSFSGDLVNARGGANPAQAYFGHHRILSPSIGDQRVFNKVRPGDAQEYIIEIKEGDAANAQLKIEVFTK